MRRATAVIAAVLFMGGALAGCEQGPMQKAGEKLDKVTDQDKVIGKGPAEKAGKEIDSTVRDIKR